MSLKFGDKVEIISGFYKDCVGFLIEANDTKYCVEGYKQVGINNREFGTWEIRDNLRLIK